MNRPPVDTVDVLTSLSLLAAVYEPRFDARYKLEMLAAASELESLRIPPSNRLEKLKGSRSGQYSIRINDQWRICFVWKSGNAREVEIVDYH